MKTVLIKSISFIVVIIIGYILKKRDVFKVEDTNFLNKLIMNVTLPCALVSGFEGTEISGIMLWCIFIGFIVNVVMVLIARIVSRGRGNKERALCTLNMPSYNIGNFVMPFAQAFLGASALATICMFDSGNSIMTLGGTYSYTSLRDSDSEEKGRWTDIPKNLIRSVPFDIYVVLLILSYFSISIPNVILEITSFIGGANAFLAMLMIGIMIEFKIDKNGIKIVKEIIVIRYIMAIVFSLIIYYLLPFSDVIKQSLIICCFAPIASVTAMFSRKCDCDESIVGIVNSLCILISIVFIVTILTIII